MYNRLHSFPFHPYLSDPIHLRREREREREMIKRVDAATVVCLRQRLSSWEVLMGQSHVVDWLKSKGPTVRRFRVLEVVNSGSQLSYRPQSTHETQATHSLIQQTD